MNNEQNNKCHAIIHSCAVADAGGNAIPVPGTGFAADILAMTTMTMGLAAVFGKKIESAVARGLAIAALKKQVCKGPIKILARELVKIVPWGGQAAAATISFAMMEAAGWSIANEFDNGLI